MVNRIDPPPEPYDTAKCQEVARRAVRPRLRHVIDILREIQDEYESAYCGRAMRERLRRRIFDEIEVNDPDRTCPQITDAIKEIQEAL